MWVFDGLKNIYGFDHFYGLYLGCILNTTKLKTRIFTGLTAFAGSARDALSRAVIFIFDSGSVMIAFVMYSTSIRN